MQQGIQSLMPQGSQQGPMPGQAPQMPMPGMMPKQGAPTPPAMVGPLTQMHLDQLMQLMLNPRPEGPPLYAVISAITEKQKQAQAQANMQRQMAMAQGQQAAQQPPVAQQVMQAAMQQAPVGAAQGGIMQGYAGGGAVAFAPGGSTSFEPFRQKIAEYQDAIKQLRAATQSGDSASAARYAQVVQTLRQQLEPKLMEVARYKSSEAEAPAQVAKIFEQGIPTAARAVAPTPSTPDLMGESLVPAPSTPDLMGESLAPAAPPAQPSRPLTRPSAGIAQPRPQAAPPSTLGLGSFVEQTGTPAPDALSELESEKRAQSVGLQKLYDEQSKVDPRIVAARQAAADLAQRNLAGREKRAEEALAAASSPMSQGLINNQEALLRIAGAFGSGKRFAQSAAAAAREAGGIRGEQRKAFEAAQRENRMEQNALDQLRQAQADLKLAQETGDVQAERTAKLKIEEIKSNFIDKRFEYLKERSTQEDRAEQRRLTARGQDLTQQTAREQMANLMALERMRQNAPKPDQDQIKRAEDLKLNELTGGKPDTATPAQKLEALTFALNTVKGAPRADTVEAQNTNRAMTALENWRKGAGKDIQRMNIKTPEVYANAEKQEIARIKQVYGVDLSVPSAGAATTTKSGATVSNWN